MVLHCDFHSPVLRRNTHINVILPTPGETGKKVQQNMKVLYLLHGLHGDETSWLQFSNIARYADEAGIAVVIPGVGNSFYQNMAHGEDFFTYITEELYEFVQALFPVSKKREDTFIAGLSMGGYGAWYLALACPEKFSATASFSGVAAAWAKICSVAKAMAYFSSPSTMAAAAPCTSSGFSGWYRGSSRSS